MACRFHEDSSGWFGNTYGYCMKDNKNGDPVSKDQWYDYCKDNWDKCSKYNENDSVCFITRAVCGIGRQADDCYVLSMMRKFRDEKMSKEDVNTYYRISPRIISELDKMNDIQRKTILESVWITITKLVRLLEEQRMDEAYDGYCDLLKTLAIRLNVNVNSCAEIPI